MRAKRWNSGKRKEAAIARQQHGKLISAAKNQHAMMEVLLEVVFSMLSLPRLYTEDQQQSLKRRLHF
jgi:GTP1/Obg family GTP-binding protein